MLGAEERDVSKNHLHDLYFHGIHTLIGEPNSMQIPIQVCTCNMGKYQEERAHGIVITYKVGGFHLFKVVRNSAPRT